MGNTVNKTIGKAPLFKPTINLLDKFTPEFVKSTRDKLMPDSVRQGIQQTGASNYLSNPNSETNMAVNKANEAATAEEQRLKIQRAFAAKYNNQVKML